MSDTNVPLTRRDLLKTTAGTAIAAALSTGLPATAAATKPRQSDLIKTENEKPGTRDWQLTNTKVAPETLYRCPWVEGYCSRNSVRAGEPLSIMVSTNPASAFTIDIYRLGYYTGLGGRHMLRLGPFKGSVQPEPEVGPERLRECRWEPATTIKIPDDWTSGVYVGKLTAEPSGLQSYVIFIVRDDRPCDFLFQSSDTTWSAYNRWPFKWSLYDDGVKTVPMDWYLGPDVRVSWDRPYGKYRQVVDQPLTQGSGSFFLWEYPLAFWMEQHGYDVSYISNVDTHADLPGLLRAKSWISVGHDEYWSASMFDNMKTAVALGLNAAFFSGDTCWGLIDLQPNSAGIPHRSLARIGQFGPLDEQSLPYAPELKRFKNFLPTEASLIGARNVFPYNGPSTAWVCTNEKNWIFAGTGMKNGDGIPGLVGFEWMGGPADIPGLEVVASGTVKAKEADGIYTATIYPGPKNNFVFNAATIWWADGLSEPPGYLRPDKKLQGPDPRVQGITQNLFERFQA